MAHPKEILSNKDGLTTLKFGEDKIGMYDFLISNSSSPNMKLYWQNEKEQFIKAQDSTIQKKRSA